MRPTCSQAEIDEILKIPIGPTNEKDRWIWYPDSRGKFTVKSAYHTIRKSTVGQQISGIALTDKAMWKWMWRIPIPPKFGFFVWRATHHALATKLNLWKRKCSPNPRCPLCQNATETTHHCLFYYRVADEVWRQGFPTVPRPDENTTLLKWLAETKETHPSFDVKQGIAALWSIWKARNGQIFRNSIPKKEAIKHSAEMIYEEWGHIRDHPLQTQQPLPARPNPVLNPPPQERAHQSIYCDGSFDQVSPVAGFGIIIIDSHGHVTGGRAGKLLCSSAIVSEAKAIFDAMRIASESTIRTIIKSDCLVLVDALRSPREKWPWQCYSWILSMQELLSAHNHISVAFVPRRLNRAADWIAHGARLDSLPLNYFSKTLYLLISSKRTTPSG
ncbi:Putative ribonuclease H protein At1g65750 [Linum grandiflorum]